MKKTQSLFILILLVFSSTLLLSSNSSIVFSQLDDNDKIKCVLEIEVKDIDEGSRKALINIKARLENETCSFPTVILLVSGGNQWPEFYCGSRGGFQTEYYEGESGEIWWQMQSGGEMYPFDFYELRFWVQQIYRREGSETVRFEDQAIVDNRTYGRLFPEVDPDVLYSKWSSMDDMKTLPQKSESERRFSLIVNKKLSLSNQFLIIPLFVAYIFLPVGISLDSEDRMKEKLATYLAIFALVLSFYYFAVINSLPFHINLTIIEFLIFNIIVSVAILSFVNVVFRIKNRKNLFIRIVATSIASIIFVAGYFGIYFPILTQRNLTIPLVFWLLPLLFIFSYSLCICFEYLNLKKNKRVVELNNRGEPSYIR